MANKTFVVQYLIKARDQFSRQANKVAHALKKVEKNTNKANKANSRLNKAFIGGMKRMGAAAVAFGGVALGAFGFSKLLTVGQQFQDSMLNLKAITGATGKDFEYLENQAMRLAKASVTSHSEVAKGMELIGSAKPELLQNLPLLAATTEQILLLKNASGLDFSTATDVAMVSLNTFGKTAKSTAEYVNILAAGAKFGSSMIPDTGEAALLAGGQAEMAGLSFLELNAMIQLVGKSFKGSRAGTALNSIFGKLATSKRYNLGELGLSKSIEKLKADFEGMPSIYAKAAYMKELFGEEHSKVAATILKNADLLEYYKTVLKGTTTAEEQAAIRMGSFSTKIRALSVAIDEKLIAAFLRLEPTFNKYAEQFGTFLDTMDDKDIDQFVENIKGIAIAFDSVASAIASVVRGYKAVEYYSEKYNPFAAVTKLARDKILGNDDAVKENSMKVLNSPLAIKTPADNLNSFLNIGVNVGLDKGLTQTGAAKVKSSGMMRAPNVGMTTEQPA